MVAIKSYCKDCFLKNRIVAVAFLCAAVLYAPAVLHHPLTLRSSPLVSLVPHSEITALTGTIASNPIKTRAFGGSYRASYTVQAVFAKDGVVASASGSATLYFPQALVEAYYPKKLYSAAKESALLVEQGASIKVHVVPVGSAKAGEPCAFLVQNAAPCRERRFSHLSYIRALCRLQFKRLMAAWGEAGGLVLALLSGSREYLADDVSAAFIGSGLSHVLALSGMHLSLISVFVCTSGSMLSRRIASVLQLGALLCFVWFAGLTPSLVRALLCTLIMCSCAYLRLQQPSLLQALSAAFLLQTAFFPQHVYEAAFMLSYGALLGIAFFSPVCRRYACRILPFASNALADSASAQIATAPISAALFSRIAPIGIVSAVVISPLITLFLYLAIAGLAVSLLLPFLSPAVCGMIQACYMLIKACVSLFARVRAITF